MNVRRYVWVLIVLLVLVTACSKGKDNKPSVKILSPSDQYTLELGETLQVESRAKDDNGISQVELRINGFRVDVVDVPGDEKSFRVTQNWIASDVGVHRVTVIAFDSQGQVSESAGITVIVGPATLPSAEATPTPTGGEPTSPPTGPTPAVCAYDVTFVTDVTIPDDTHLAPGTEFVKTWRLRNTGTCDWGAGFQFVFVDGERMDSPASVNVPAALAGNTFDISVSFIAPQQPGAHQSRWRIRTADGQDFGDYPFVRIVVPPPATPTPQATPTATPTPKPDLDIALVSGNLELLVGEPLALRVTVRNHGPGPTRQSALVRAVLWVGLEMESSVATLPAGAQEVALLTHTFAEPAELEVFISVDPNGEIAEENEENNTEKVPLVVNPPLYVTRTITATPGISFDLDDGEDKTDSLDIEWRVVEGTVYLRLLNDAGAAFVSGEADSVSYALVAGLTWETEQLALADVAEGTLFGFRTSDGRVGYARVDTVLDEAHTSARLSYWVWDW